MKIQKKVRQLKPPEENLDKVGVLLPEEGEDINSSLERTELKSRLKRQVMKLLCICRGRF